LNNIAHRDNPDGPFFSVCGQICGQKAVGRDGQAKIVTGKANIKAITEYFKAGNPPLPIYESMRWYKQRESILNIHPFYVLTK